MRTVTLVVDAPRGGFIYIDADNRTLKLHRPRLGRDIVLIASRAEDAADLATAIADMVAEAKSKAAPFEAQMPNTNETGNA